MIVSNGLGLDQDRHCVGPDLGPSCLQSISADYKKVASSKEKVKQATNGCNVVSLSGLEK